MTLTKDGDRIMEMNLTLTSKLSSLRCVLVLIFISMFFGASVNAQSTKTLRISESKSSTKPVECAEGSKRLIDVSGRLVGCEVLQEDKKGVRNIVSLGSGQSFMVEAFLGTMVSEGGNTILKYGDFGDIVRNTRRELSWVLYSNTGQVLAESTKHTSNSIIAMSRDGYFVVVGARRDQDKTDRLYMTFYSPTGKARFMNALEAGQFVTNAAVRHKGSTIALALSTKTKDKRGISDVTLYDKKGTAINTVKEIKRVNTLIFSGKNENHLFIFAISSLLNIDADKGAVLWRSMNFYRLASPYAAAVSNDNAHLAIITAELADAKKAKYTWRTRVVSMREGKILNQRDLDDQYQPGRPINIKWLTNRSFHVLATDKKQYTINFD